MKAKYESIALCNLTIEKLRSSLIDDKYLLTTWINFQSQIGKVYLASHAYYKLDPDKKQCITLASSDKDEKDFKRVQKIIEKEIRLIEPRKEIYDRFKDIAVQIYTRDNLNQRFVADLAEKYKIYFRNVNIYSVHFSLVPKDICDRISITEIDIGYRESSISF